VGEHDFDQDGKPGIIVAFGDRLVSLPINIFKVYPPKEHRDLIGNENIKLVGKFLERQSYIFIEENKIVLPFDGQGRFIAIKNAGRSGGRFR
jgi:hypothetical protein